METTGIVILETKGTLATIRLGAENEGLVILNRKRLESFRDALRAVKADRQLTALIIVGTKRGFCAGADINLINSLSVFEDAEKLAREGQQIFDELENIGIPTIAAISGACVGGGCELVLACKHRIGTPESKIGLPEIKLGILPGFGGTQRLPRLVGVPQALDIILQGKTVPAKKALSIGLYDLIVEDLNDLERMAADVVSGRRVVEKPKLSFQDKFLSENPIGRKLANFAAKKKVLSTTKGHYPAPLKALESVFNGLSVGKERGLLHEAKLLAELAISPESKALVHVYFLTEWAGKLGRAAKDEVVGAKISVIGAGTMGAGIAGAFLSRGFKVGLIEPIEQVQERAREQINSFIAKQRALSDKEKEAALKKLELGGKFEIANNSKVVIEAIIEDVDTKKEVFEKLAKQVSTDCILASNTSSLSVDSVTGDIPAKDRVIGMHFFNPAEKMPLVEIVRAKNTSEKSIIYTAALTAALGKYPVVVENVPGFLVNRILTPYLVEAAHLVFEGYRIEDIDKAAKSFGMPMGPIRLLDEVGLPVAAKVSEVLAAAYGERMSGPNYAKMLVEQGRMGKKSNLGFYKYSGKKEVVDQSVYKLLGLRTERKSKANRNYLTDRLILSMLNEAVCALDEGVAGAPGADAAKQIDLASVMGTGFAPFRGGIIKYADTRGAKEIARVLDGFVKEGIARLEPCAGLRKRGEAGAGFYI